MELNTFVSSKLSFRLKKIVDKEIICGETIYYTDDNNSYHESQISNSSLDIKKALINEINKNKEIADDIYKNMVKDVALKTLDWLNR